MSRDETIHLIALALSTHSVQVSLDRLGIGYSLNQVAATIANQVAAHLGEAEAVYESLHQVEEAQRTGSFPVMHFARDYGVDYGDVLIMFAYYLRTDRFYRIRKAEFKRQEFLASKRLMDHDPGICHEIEVLAQAERERREKVI